jgi:predicted nucleotidyltransferase
MERVPDVEEAFVFGSMARGTLRASSDVDLFIIGKPDFAALARALGPLEVTWGVEIHATVMTSGDLQGRLAAGSGFAQAVMSGPCIAVLARNA